MRDLIWHFLMLAFWGTGFMGGVLWEKRKASADIERIIKAHASREVGLKLSDGENKAVIKALQAYKRAYYE